MAVHHRVLETGKLKMTYDVGFMNARLRAQGNTLVFGDHDASFFLGNRS